MNPEETIERIAPADTIAAEATPPGRGGVGIVRVSGPDVPEIARAVLGIVPEPRRATLTTFRDERGEPLDHGLSLYFPEPRSFTGEHLLELHGHGGPVVMDMLLERILALGARLARPGEFSERAFFNDKLDLAQAEALADLIDSGSSQAARAAMRSLRGEFSERIHQLTEALIELRMYVEAAIDFPEEEIDFLADRDLEHRLTSIVEQFDGLEAAATQGCLLQEGMTVVITGRPNAGKSSLLNRLAGHEAAIVTEIPGTTRDLLKERIDIDGMPLHLVDTAGLHDSRGPVEAEGIRRAHEQLAHADRALLVIDAADSGRDEILQKLRDELPSEIPSTVVWNKIDLTGESPGLSSGELPAVRLSAKIGDGVEQLRQHLKACMGYRSAGAGTLSARRRHLDALKRAHQNVLEGRRQLVESRAGELMAEELRCAQEALGEITGQFTSEDLLGRIFASFCIGK